MEELMKALHAIAKPGEIDITVRGTGWFPDEKHPRVFWAGVDADDRLAYLARSTEQGVATLGAPAEERAYSPHLTLARIRDHVSLDTLRGAIAVANSDFGAFRAGHFALYVSAGGTYTQLAKFPLQFPHEHEEGKTTWES